MKRFEFPLDVVLRHKRRHEQVAELRLAQARAAEQAARERVALLREQLRGLAREMADSAVRAETAGAWAARFERSDRLATAVRAAEQALAIAAAAAEEAARDRARIGSEVEALQTLRRQRWAEYRHEAQRQEQIRLDETGLRRWAKEGEEG